MNPKTQLNAFLAMIRWSEGTATSPYTRHHGYDVIVSGVNSPHVFTDFSKHPDILVTFNPKAVPASLGQSTAAGGYQLLFRIWSAYQKMLGLPDFTPASQDAVAIHMISERHAMDDINNGRLASAIAKCSGAWASLPGNHYNQGGRTIAALTEQFIEAGGQVAA